MQIPKRNWSLYTNAEILTINPDNSGLKVSLILVSNLTYAKQFQKTNPQ